MIKLNRKNKMTDEERYIHLHLDGGQIQVKLEDEGVVVDAIGDGGELIGSTWKLYTEMGVEVKPIKEPV
tara:strand:+ start:9 stop:215 length:207 start_codon:yes stop_codon:yes gene_type:complete